MPRGVILDPDPPTANGRIPNRGKANGNALTIGIASAPINFGVLEYNEEHYFYFDNLPSRRQPKKGDDLDFDIATINHSGLKIAINIQAS